MFFPADMTLDFEEYVAGGLFCIPEDDGSYTLFAPFHGLVMSVNAAFARQVRRAAAADGEPPAELGVDAGTWRSLLACPPELAARFKPRDSEPYSPNAATLFLTQRCTLRCRYCYCHGGAGATMSMRLAERAIELTLANAVSAGMQRYSLSIHGGDVGACWPLFTNVVDYARRRAGEVGLEVTVGLGANGYYTAEQAEFIVQNTSEATLSWDGPPAVQDRLRPDPAGAPSSARVLRTARIFDAQGYRYSIRMTVVDEYLAGLADAVAYLCESCGAKEIRAEPLYRRGRAVESDFHVPDPRRFVTAYREAETVARRHGRRLSYSAARTGLVTGCFCSYSTPTFGVTPQGDLTCCYEVLTPDDPLSKQLFFGRLDPDTLDLLLDDTRIADIRREARRRREACVRCFCVAHCAGDCVAKAVEQPLPGDDRLPVRCAITRELTRDQLRRLMLPEAHARAAAPVAATRSS
jgi:uncharacterized protein